MSTDWTTPLPDISPEEPTGPNLEFDPDFAEFERLSVGKPEQQFGDTIVPAEEPDWKAVIAAGEALMGRTYDLRVMAQLAAARLQRDGFGGYAETIATIRQALTSRWAELHPLLDPEDDNDPTLRANALLAAAAPLRVMRVLRNLPLARSARAGQVCWRDIATSEGALESETGTTAMTETVIAAAFRETDQAVLTAFRADLAATREAIIAIPAVFDGATGYGTGPDYRDLGKLLADIQKMVDRFSPTVSAVAEEDATEVNDDEGVPVTVGDMTPSPRRSIAISIDTLGPINNRADAIRLLDMVIGYYERNEPSSPLPLLIGRARRLAEKGFLDLLRDLAPDGLGQAERLAGDAG